MSGWKAVNDEWGTTPSPNDAWASGGQDGATQACSSFTGGAGDGGEADASVEKCFSCGDPGHRVADCPTPREMTCRYCKQPGHLVKDCPDKPPMKCDNCGEDGHMRKTCQNARVINRDHIADSTPEDAWQKLQEAVKARDIDDTKEAIQEYVKALGGSVTYRQLQEAMLDKGIELFFIALERPLVNVFTNMDLQGNMGKKYSISYRFSEKPDRPREADSFPKSRDELLDRLDDAGEVTNRGLSLCHNCGELGHSSKFCTQEKAEKFERPKISCSNCGDEGHRLRDCPQPRVDKFACRNCGQSGHKVAECTEPPNLDNVECRKCHEMGHFSKDCPQAGPRGCHNCGAEGHMAKECDQPRNMDRVTCRNCDETGHMSRDCPKPRDWSRVQCTNCQQFGHSQVRCKQAPAEPEAFDNGGGGNTGGHAAGESANAGDSWGGGGGGGTSDNHAQFSFETDVGGW